VFSPCLKKEVSWHRKSQCNGDVHSKLRLGPIYDPHPIRQKLTMISCPRQLDRPSKRYASRPARRARVSLFQRRRQTGYWINHGGLWPTRMAIGEQNITRNCAVGCHWLWPALLSVGSMSRHIDPVRMGCARTSPQ